LDIIEEERTIKFYYPPLSRYKIATAGEAEENVLLPSLILLHYDCSWSIKSGAANLGDT